MTATKRSLAVGRKRVAEPNQNPQEAPEEASSVAKTPPAGIHVYTGIRVQCPNPNHTQTANDAGPWTGGQIGLVPVLPVCIWRSGSAARMTPIMIGIADGFPRRGKSTLVQSVWAEAFCSHGS